MSTVLNMVTIMWLLIIQIEFIDCSDLFYIEIISI